MNVREVPQQQQQKPRYGIDPYLDWLKGEGIPVVEDYGIYLFDVKTAPWPRYGVNGAAVHLQGPRRFRQHVRLRDRARQVDDAAAPSLRRGHLRARGPRLDPARVRRRQQAQLRVGTSAACSPSRSTPSTGTSTAAARERALLGEHHQPADGDEHLSQRDLRLRQRFRFRRARGQERIFRRRGRSHHGAARATTCGKRTSFPT